MKTETVSKRVLWASLIGSSIEWFDYFLYGTVAALVFNQLFFPAEDPAVGTMLAFASFALSFFIRPFGGIIFSHIGDRIGRKKTLVLTLGLMGGATRGRLSVKTVPAPGWKLLLLVPQDNLFRVVDQLRRNATTVAWLMVALPVALARFRFTTLLPRFRGMG